MNKQKLPNEIINEIFPYVKASPSYVKGFSKIMSIKNKKRMLNCREIIKTGDLSEVKKLKKFSDYVTECNHDDMLYATDKGFEDIVIYLNNFYPMSQITKSDINDAISSGNLKKLNIFFKAKRFTYTYDEYLRLFEHVNVRDKKLISYLVDNFPFGDFIYMSHILFHPSNQEKFTNLEFIKNLINTGKTFIDDNLIITYLSYHYFEIGDYLISLRPLSTHDKQVLLNFAVSNRDGDLLDYIVRVLKYFEM